MKHLSRPAIVLALLFVLAVPLASFAQSDAARLWSVVTVEVHPDMAMEFEGLQKELNAAYEKAGMTERRISRVVRGNTNEYLIATPHASYADLDNNTAFMTKAMGWIGRTMDKMIGPDFEKGLAKLKRIAEA